MRPFFPFGLSFNSQLCFWPWHFKIWQFLIIRSFFLSFYRHISLHVCRLPTARYVFFLYRMINNRCPACLWSKWMRFCFSLQLLRDRCRRRSICARVRAFGFALHILELFFAFKFELDLSRLPVSNEHSTPDPELSFSSAWCQGETRHLFMDGLSWCGKVSALVSAGVSPLRHAVKLDFHVFALHWWGAQGRTNVQLWFKEVRGSFAILFWLPCATWHRVMTHTHHTQSIDRRFSSPLDASCRADIRGLLRLSSSPQWTFFRLPGTMHGLHSNEQKT